MAVTAFPFTKLLDSLASEEVNLNTDTIKVMLLSSYTLAQDSHKYVADVLAAGTEASGTGYTTGGATLTGVSWSQAGDTFTLDGVIPAWDATGGALSASFAVFYDATPGSDATNPVIACWDFNGTETATNGNFELIPDAAGIATLQRN